MEYTYYTSGGRARHCLAAAFGQLVANHPAGQPPWLPASASAESCGTSHPKGSEVGWREQGIDGGSGCAKSCRNLLKNPNFAPLF